MYLATQFQVSTWATALEKQPKQQKLLYNSNAGNFEFSSILRGFVAHTANSNCIEGSVERTKTIAETGQVHRLMHRAERDSHNCGNEKRVVSKAIDFIAKGETACL